VVGAWFTPDHGVLGAGGAPGPVGQREDYDHGHALLDADQGHGQQGDGGQRELEAVEAEDRAQLADPEQLGGDEHQRRRQHGLWQVSQRCGSRKRHGQDKDRSHDVRHGRRQWTG
jgi:hypothetical protein